MYIYIYTYMNIQSAKNHTTNMCLCTCFGMCVFLVFFNICPQHLHTHSTPQTQPPPPNPNNSHTLPCPLYTTTTTLFLEGCLLPPPPTHLYFFYLIAMQEITFYPPHICSLCGGLPFECCVIFLNGLCYFFQLFIFMMFSKHMFFI